MNVEQKKYIVTAKTREGMDTLCSQLETADVIPENTTIKRTVRLAERRPNSRATTYHLTEKEAVSLKDNPLVRSVEPYPSDVGITPNLNISTTQTSNWNRSFSQNSNHKQWGLYNIIEGGDLGEWTGDNTQTITLSQTGKNVDLVICDDNGALQLHPEFQTNIDGTGGSRLTLYDWYAEHQNEVGGSGTNYSYSSAGYHAIHVMGTAGGNSQGWARGANLYNLYYYSGAVGDVTFPYVFDYIREFHRTKSVNPDTGRKNPTVVNNSWGMSLFPSQWTFNDITAVTYRGTRYLPAGATYVQSGFTGLFSSDGVLDDTFTYNDGNRDTNEYTKWSCTTSGSEAQPSPEGTISGAPSGESEWQVSNNKTATLNLQQKLGGRQTVTISVTTQPFDVVLQSDVAYATPVDTVDLLSTITVVPPTGSNTVYSDGTYTGAAVSTSIDETFTLNQTGTWQIYFDTTYSSEPALDVTYDVQLLCSLQTTGGSPSGSGTLVASGQSNVSIPSVSGLTEATSTTSGTKDDGYWTLNLPFSVTYLQNNYNQIHIGTNSYITFGAGSTIEPTNSAQVPYPKIMVGSGNKDGDSTYATTSGQRIYYGTEPTGNYSTPVNTYTFTAINNSNIAYTINGTDRSGAVSGDNATINMIVGDTIEITNNSNFVHPLYLKIAQVTGTGDQVNGATGQGASQGNTVSWTPTVAGTYYYQCSNHTLMNGQIIVGANAGTNFYRVVFEGTSTSSGTLGSPNIRWEVKFDEDNPDDFTLTMEQDGQQTVSGGGSGTFTTQELNNFGFISGKRIPQRVSALDSDIEDAISEGIITIGAAGNGQWYHAEPGDQDWDNTFEMAVRYPNSVNFPYYYMRGTSPTANDTSASGGYEIPNICVGAIGTYQTGTLQNKAAEYSDRGPGVDIWAPGSYIQSAYSSSSAYGDPRNSTYRVAKISGTSMASPQVAGIIACLAEIYPDMDQYEAKAIILRLAKSGNLATSSGGYTDVADLLGTDNLTSFYRRERASSGATFPKRNFKTRPDTGQAYPRPRIRR
jgi:plastocyanin